MESKFLCEFNKYKGYVSWQSNEKFEHIGSMDGFNNSFYKKVSVEIKDSLGIKNLFYF